jgi:hypothetical protein
MQSINEMRATDARAAKASLATSIGEFDLSKLPKQTDLDA